MKQKSKDNDRLLPIDEVKKNGSIRNPEDIFKVRQTTIDVGDIGAIRPKCR